MSPRRASSSGRPPHRDVSAVPARLAQPIRDGESQRFVLRLYIPGMNQASRQAIERVKDACERHRHGRYELEVVDIYQMPALARDEQILATPTLIKILPAPIKRYIGNLANLEKVLFGLDLREKK